ALEHVSKRYGDGPTGVTALADVSLEVSEGEFLSIMGPSGSGKSTLLNLLAGLDTPDSGRVVIGGRNLAQLSDNARSDLRLREIGFVFQSFNLFPTFTVEENIAWPLEFLGLSWREARRRAAGALAQVGLASSVRDRRPAELSGGEQQRVGIARAPVTQPRLLLADAPTGNLASRPGHAVLDQASLRAKGAAPYPPAPAGKETGLDRDHVFRREGDYWTITYAGTTVRLRGTRGLHYLAQLLNAPGRELHATELVAVSGGL